MKLSQLKTILDIIEEVNIQLPDGSFIPKHFHLTEIGKMTKSFVDCGGTLRNEESAVFQFWIATDYDHRLSPKKLNRIIQASQEKLNLNDLEIEVEYQGSTIEKFGLDFNGHHFLLVNKQTDCLAKENCGIPSAKTKVKLSDLQTTETCTPGGGCC